MSQDREKLDNTISVIVNFKVLKLDTAVRKKLSSGGLATTRRKARLEVHVMISSLAQAISGFPIGEPQSPAFVTVPASILEQILSEVQALRAEVQDLKAIVSHQDGELAALRQQLEALEARQECAEERLSTDRKRINSLSDTQDEICDKLDEHAEALNTVWKAVKTAPAKSEPKGEKTLKRIAKLEEFLKARGSGATFQEVEKILGISPSELTRLIAKLDMRRYEIFARAGDGRQKVIRLKAQIR